MNGSNQTVIELELTRNLRVLVDCRYVLYTHDTTELVRVNNWCDRQQHNLMNKLGQTAQAMLYGRQAHALGNIVEASSGPGTRGILALAAPWQAVLSYIDFTTLSGSGACVKANNLVAMTATIAADFIEMDDALFDEDDVFIQLEGEGDVIIQNYIGELAQALADDESIILPLSAIMAFEPSVVMASAPRHFYQGPDWLEPAHTLVQISGPGMVWLDYGG